MEEASIKYKAMVSKSWKDYMRSISVKNIELSESQLFENEYLCRVCCMFLAHYLQYVLKIKNFDHNEKFVIAVCDSTKHYNNLNAKKHDKYLGMNFSHLKENIIFNKGFLANLPKFLFNKVVYPSNENNDLTEAIFQVYKKHFSITNQKADEGRAG